MTKDYGHIVELGLGVWGEIGKDI